MTKKELIEDGPYKAFNIILKKMMFDDVNETTSYQVRNFYFSEPRTSKWHIASTGEKILDKEKFINSFKIYQVKKSRFYYDIDKTLILDKRFLVNKNIILNMGINVDDLIIAFNFEEVEYD